MRRSCSISGTPLFRRHVARFDDAAAMPNITACADAAELVADVVVLTDLVELRRQPRHLPGISIMLTFVSSSLIPCWTSAAVAMKLTVAPFGMVTSLGSKKKRRATMTRSYSSPDHDFAAAQARPTVSVQCQGVRVDTPSVGRHLDAQGEARRW